MADQTAQDLSAQASKNLKQRGVKFDLKNGKNFTVKSHLGGIGSIAYNAKIAGLKVTAAGVESSRNWSKNKVKTYKTSDDWSFDQAGLIKIKVSITFPKKYKNLCVGIGGDMWPKAKRTKYDWNFEGVSSLTGGNYAPAYTAKYWQTSRLKKAKNNFHFIRIK